MTLNSGDVIIRDIRDALHGEPGLDRLSGHRLSGSRPSRGRPKVQLDGTVVAVRKCVTLVLDQRAVWAKLACPLSGNRVLLRHVLCGGFSGKIPGVDCGFGLAALDKTELCNCDLKERLAY